MAPRRGSLYNRLDEARAQREKSLSPPEAANLDHVNSVPKQPTRALSKSHLFPAITPQDAFDRATKSSMPTATKLGLAIVVVSMLAGLVLFGQGTDGPQTTITAPADLAETAAETRLPALDTPARAGDAPKVESAQTGSLPAIPETPAKPAVVEVQQTAEPLQSPDINGPSDVKQP